MLPSTPDIKVFVHLDDIGYQIDVYVYHQNGHVKHETECRDFAGTHDVDKILDGVASALIDTMRGFEKTL